MHIYYFNQAQLLCGFVVLRKLEGGKVLFHSSADWNMVFSLFKILILCDCPEMFLEAHKSEWRKNMNYENTKTCINCVERLKALAWDLFSFRNTYWLETETSVPHMLKMWSESFNLPSSVKVNGQSKCWSCCKTNLFSFCLLCQLMK